MEEGGWSDYYMNIGPAEVAAVLPRRMKEHGDAVKREREERKKKLAELQVPL